MAALDTTTADDGCPFFDKLPGEMRNAIYELAFTTESIDDAQPVHLPDAKPPSKAIVMTCRQAHAKAHQLQQTAYSDYWSKTKFNLNYNRADADKVKAMLLSRPIGIDQISHLAIKTTNISGCADSRIDFELLDRRRGWKVSALSVNLNVTAYLRPERGDAPTMIPFRTQEQHLVSMREAWQELPISKQLLRLLAHHE